MTENPNDQELSNNIIHEIRYQVQIDTKSSHKLYDHFSYYTYLLG